MRHLSSEVFLNGRPSSRSLNHGLKNEKQTVNAIFDGKSYYEVYRKDLLQADKNIIISSPVISGPKVYELISLLHDKQVAGELKLQL